MQSCIAALLILYSFSLSSLVSSSRCLDRKSAWHHCLSNMTISHLDKLSSQVTHYIHNLSHCHCQRLASTLVNFGPSDLTTLIMGNFCVVKLERVNHYRMQWVRFTAHVCYTPNILWVWHTSLARLSNAHRTIPSHSHPLKLAHVCYTAYKPGQII